MVFSTPCPLTPYIQLGCKALTTEEPTASAETHLPRAHGSAVLPLRRHPLDTPGAGATGVQPRLVNCRLLPVFWFHIWKYRLCRPSVALLSRETGGAPGRLPSSSLVWFPCSGALDERRGSEPPRQAGQAALLHAASGGGHSSLRRRSRCLSPSGVCAEPWEALSFRACCVVIKQED